MTIKKTVILLIITLSVFSCRQHAENSLNQELEQNPVLETFGEFKILFPALKDYNWKIYSGHESLGSIIMELDGKSGDTTLVAALIKATYEDDNGSHIDYILSDSFKQFTVKNLNHIQKINGTGKVLYHYFYKGSNEEYNNLTFISGKYRYLFEERMLDSKQLEFYLANKDSLDHLKGNQAWNNK